MLSPLPTKVLSPVLLITQLVVIAASPIGFAPLSGHRSRGLKYFSSKSDPDKFVGFHYAPKVRIPLEILLVDHFMTAVGGGRGIQQGSDAHSSNGYRAKPICRCLS
ncbi:MAG: hypothetical protein NXY57DRAFT_1027898 [Lentinula lateritia]|nr:MAG: hypothetical protein NXY57DRAFT_1027898 [Lentinula lateritia]